MVLNRKTSSSRGFHTLDEISNNANIGIRGFTKWKKSCDKMLPPVEITQASHSLWFQVQHSPFYTNLAFTWTTETLGCIYSHALLIPTKSSKSKNQVVHEQKFKDLLSSTCQVGVETRVLDLESGVMRGLGSIPTGGNIFHQLFFSHSEASDANIGIIANVVCLWKPRVKRKEFTWCSLPVPNGWSHLSRKEL